MKTTTASDSASAKIDHKIEQLEGWRGRALAKVRKIIHDADPEIVEEWKWVKATNPGTPVWSRGGIVCTGEAYKAVVKLTFAKGASLTDPARLFNASLEGNVRRAIDIREGDKINAAALKTLIRSAVALNLAGKNESKSAPRRRRASPKLLSGGNPQIAKGDGDAPVQAYIAAMPGWKRDVGRQLDTLIERAVPGVRKAVRWNTPFYGVEGRGWFLGFHCFAKYVKLTFLRGAALKPMPPIESKHEHVRYHHINEERDELDEKLLVKWIKQAAKLPGDPLF